MAEDRLKRDFDDVENLDDLIKAREERVSAFADDVDAMPDLADEGLVEDPNKELTFPHPHTQSDEYGAAGTNTGLMSTHHESEVEFDWQDSAEEMLDTDPEPDEGMGEDSAITALSSMEATDLIGPIPSVAPSAETDTAATDEEKREYGMDGGEPVNRPTNPVQLEDAMDTDSDQNDFSIDEKFAGQVNHESALYEFQEIEQEIKKESGEK